MPPPCRPSYMHVKVLWCPRLLIAKYAPSIAPSPPVCKETSDDDDDDDEDDELSDVSRRALTHSLRDRLELLVNLDACQRLLQAIQYRGFTRRRPSSSSSQGSPVSQVAELLDSGSASLMHTVSSARRVLTMELKSLNEECKKLVQGGLIGREYTTSIRDENERFLVLAERTMKYIRERLYQPAKHAQKLLILLPEVMIEVQQRQQRSSDKMLLVGEGRLLDKFKKSLVFALDAVRDNALDKIINATPEHQTRRRKLNREIEKMMHMCGI